uniref:Ras association domain-containing protein 8-like n=1 Tax=Hippocampus comes TaxID=109280 RepID=A0A3Q2XGF9_HIPCM
MEIKVSVDGLPRLVCGVTDETTCQEVVTVLAQALGQPGRYMLRETFKDFERCMAPAERPLEMLKKYGEHAKDVQLTLLHSGPSVSDEMSRAKAWEWLENLGKTQVYSTSCDQEKNKKSKKTRAEKLDSFSNSNSEDEKNHLRETIICQLSYLQKLQVQIGCVDNEILELEESERTREEQKLIEEEMEQIRFWENELKAEEEFERDLQNQFHDMKAKVVDCKAKLEDYKNEMQKLNFCEAQNVDSKGGRRVADDNRTKDSNRQLFETELDVNSDRKWTPRNFNPSPASFPPSQIKERRYCLPVSTIYFRIVPWGVGRGAWVPEEMPLSNVAQSAPGVRKSKCHLVFCGQVPARYCQVFESLCILFLA